MRDDATKFKVVDDSHNPINIADLFKTEASAQKFIDYHMGKQKECQKDNEEGNLTKFVYNYYTQSCTEIPAGGSSTSENGVTLIFEKLEHGKELIVNTLPINRHDDIKGNGYNIDQRIEEGDGVRYNIAGDFANCFDIGIYVKLNTNKNDETVFKVYGGPHSKNTPKLARCYDVGIKFDGSTVRVRTEHEHNDGSGPYSGDIKKKNIRLGDLRNKWVGYRFIGIHKEAGDHQDSKPTTRLITFVDLDGLTNGNPSNSWIKVADWIDDGTVFFDKTQEKYNEDLKHGPPYGKYPYDSDKAQQTIRIDEVRRHRGDVEDKFMWCWQINPTKPIGSIAEENDEEERGLREEERG
jgi:hypothetical protein